MDIDERQQGVSYRRCSIAWYAGHTLETQQAPQAIWITETLQTGVNPVLQPSVDVSYGGVSCTILS